MCTTGENSSTLDARVKVFKGAFVQEDANQLTYYCCYVYNWRELVYSGFRSKSLQGCICTGRCQPIDSLLLLCVQLERTHLLWMQE